MATFILTPDFLSTPYNVNMEFADLTLGVSPQTVITGIANKELLIYKLLIGTDNPADIEVLSNTTQLGLLPLQTDSFYTIDLSPFYYKCAVGESFLLDSDASIACAVNAFYSIREPVT